MDKKFDVAVIGELNPDLILSGDVVPEFGQTEKLVNQAQLTIGSSSAIFACGAARLGLRVAFIGMVGNDLFGRFMCSSLEEYKIDTTGIILDREMPTGISVILSTGEDRAILTYMGTISRLTTDAINMNIIHNSRHLHVGSYFIQKGLQVGLPGVFDQAHEWGLTTSLDTNFNPDDEWDGGLADLLPKADIFLPNQLECLKITKAIDLHHALDALQPKVKSLGVKLGKNGALLRQESIEISTKALSVDVYDTVGAGDSFDAGFIYGYLAGWEPEKNLKFATVCGGLSTRKAGGTAAQPTLEEALGYL